MMRTYNYEVGDFVRYQGDLSTLTAILRNPDVGRIEEFGNNVGGQERIYLYLLKAKKQSKDVIFYLIGIHPDYQNKGVTAIIFNEYYNTFKKNGIVNCIRSPELEDNIAIHLLWKNFNPIVHCKRKTYRKDL